MKIIRAEAMIVSPYSMFKLLYSKTLIRVYKELLVYWATGYPKNLVSTLTKDLQYKNKSTVSRALKQLRSLGYINSDNNITLTDVI